MVGLLLEFKPFSNSLLFQWGITVTQGITSDGAYANLNFPISFSSCMFNITALHTGTLPVILNEIYANRTKSYTTLLGSTRFGTMEIGWTYMYFIVGV